MVFSKIGKIISDISRCDYNYFLNKKNVIGIGKGYKVTNGFNTQIICIKVFVVKKILQCRLSKKDIIPRYFKGIKTDVVETGPFSVASLRERVRPVKGGYSISANMNEMSGTAGILVTNGVSKFVLSSNHILADQNNLPIGHPIVQPSYKYNGRDPLDTIGTLYRYVPLRPVDGATQPINFSDCAIGLLTTPNILSPEIAFIGKITCIKSPRLNTQVQKVGSTSELTEGIITSIDDTLNVNYPRGRSYIFQNVIMTTRMGQEGDSGSILVNKNKCAVGMLFGNTGNTSAFNRLDRIVDQLDVHLVK